jgi:hypothetical protein
MFYCENCRVENDWPSAFTQSYGRCEMCGKTALCWDRPSSGFLPVKPKCRIKLNEGGWYRVVIGTIVSPIINRLENQERSVYGKIAFSGRIPQRVEWQFEELARAYCQKAEKVVEW